MLVTAETAHSVLTVFLLHLNHPASHLRSAYSADMPLQSINTSTIVKPDLAHNVSQPDRGFSIYVVCYMPIASTNPQKGKEQFIFVER